ncbi:hypothetical protein GE09DRAFT_1106371 [Coniochaeta sp. 2T2.1]|nr:hypothetical protein GE09DRAFT_1106371 [Coniochaeta sp. 2T2.1]
MPEDIDDFLEAGAKEHIGNARNFVKENWAKKGAQAKPILAAIRKLLDLVDAFKAQIETIEASGKATEAKAKDGLKTFYGEARLARIWRAEGDLMPPWLRQALLDLRRGRAPLPGGQGEEQLQGPAPARRKPASQSGRRTTKQPPPTPATPAARPAAGNSSAASAPNGSLSMPPPTATGKRPATCPATNTNSEPQQRSKKPRKSGVPNEPPADDPPGTGKWVSKKDVEGKHWTFKYPILGPEFYVLLCNPDPAKAHRFTENPIRRHAAVRHFAMSARDAPCHRDVQGLPAHMSELGIMQRYGYQVDFMSLEDSINSNNEITVKQVERQAESEKAAAPNGRGGSDG